MATTNDFATVELTTYMHDLEADWPENTTNYLSGPYKNGDFVLLHKSPILFEIVNY